MARVLKIKKYALHSFDHQVNQSLSMNLLDATQMKQTIMIEDQDIKLRLAHRKFVFTETKNAHHYQQIQNNQQKSIKQPQLSNQEKQNITQNKNEIKIERSNQKNKSKFKRFILLSNYNKQPSQSNLVIQHKIERLRKNKEQEVMNNQNARSMFNTPDRSRSHHVTINTNTYDFRKTQNNFRRQRQCNTYIPIGYNGQILQKKVSKISELDKYQTHFINMDISVMSNNYCQSAIEKQNKLIKSLQLKGRQKKSNQILYIINDDNAKFKVPLKKPSQEQVKFQFERKLQNFINKNQNEKVKLTLRELRLFKQILYRKREQQYFLAQKQIQVQRQANRKQTMSLHKQTIGSTKKMIKKQQVNISNLKNYSQLISIQPSQEFNKTTERKNYQKKKHLGVTFNTTRNISKYGLNNNPRSKTIRRTWNGRQLEPPQQKAHIL